MKKRFYIFSQSLFVFLLCIVHHLSYPASRDGACGADFFFSLCIERLKRSSFLFFPGKEKKPVGVGPPRSKNPIVSEFPPRLRQEAAYIAFAMPVAFFLASKKIPLIQSDNDRRGPTPGKKKETADRNKFAEVMGRSDAQP